MRQRVKVSTISKMLQAIHSKVRGDKIIYGATTLASVAAEESLAKVN